MRVEERVYLTKEGAKELRKELEFLSTVKRTELAERLRHAIQQGDLSENADYQAAKEEQGFLEGRIQEIQATLRLATIIDESAGGTKVRIGSHVSVLEAGSNVPETYHIVGSAEADPGNGKVSHDSPLGRALIGHSVGDTVQVKAPVGVIAFEILKID